MALKRKINDEEKDTEDIKRRQVEDLMRSAAASSSSSSSSSSATGQDIREKVGNLIALGQARLLSFLFVCP